MAELTPLWTPSESRLANAPLTAFRQQIAKHYDEQIEDYFDLHVWSVRNPQAFWSAIWDFSGIVASERGERITADFPKMPGTRWFPDARLNFAENLLKRRDDAIAIDFIGEDGRHIQLSFAQLYRQVAGLAAAMRDHGVVAGDRVAGYMPNMPETVIAMLAAASIGAIWSSCSPDFGVNGILDRFGQIKPKMLFCADAYFYNGKSHDCLDKVTQILGKIPSITKTVVVPYAAEGQSELPNSDCSYWINFLKNEVQDIEFAQLPFDHPLYVLYSSGTTGVPKCIVHSAGGTLLQHRKEHLLHTSLTDQDALFYFTTCGWMMWNWLVTALAGGTRIVLFDGSPFYPSSARLFDLIDKLDITVFGTSAKYISAIEKDGLIPRESHQLNSLKTILSTGSPLLPESFDYCYRDIKDDLCVSSISGGTDIVSCFALGCDSLPVYKGQLQCPGLGMDVEILNDAGEAVFEEKGELSCATPFPAMPVGFWNDPDGERYHDAYFSRVAGKWCHGDHAEITAQGGMIIYGRSDATLNPGGVRIGTAEIYRQVEKLDEVVESIAVGQEWGDDVRVVLFVRLREGLALDDTLIAQIRKTIRANTTPRHVPAVVAQVTDIPRTISGKIVELAVREVIHGRPVKNTDALANPEALDQFKDREELAQH